MDIRVFFVLFMSSVETGQKQLASGKHLLETFALFLTGTEMTQSKSHSL